MFQLPFCKDFQVTKKIENEITHVYLISRITFNKINRKLSILTSHDDNLKMCLLIKYELQFMF